MALDERHRAHANSFGAVADAYERGRPQYPAEAIDWLVPAHAARVADLWAGTGKLTRQLGERGLTGGGDIALRMVTHCSRADLPG